MAASDRIDELKKRYDENPRRFFASLANEYRKSGDLEQAITLCQTHLAEQPSNMNGHVVYGQALFEAGRYDEAKTTFETALQLDPENLIALRHLGDIACTNGANAEAREWYVRVLDADPRNEEIIALLTHLEAEVRKDAIGAPISSVESMAPREARGVDFKPPQVLTPLSNTPISSPAVAEGTPVVPIESVDTLQMEAVPKPAEAPSAEIGLMDLSLDFDTPADPAHAASAPPVASENADTEFLTFGDLSVDSPAAEPAPAVTAPTDVDSLGDIMMDPFADPAPVELEPWSPSLGESAPADSALTEPSPLESTVSVEAQAEIDAPPVAATTDDSTDMLFGDTLPADPAPPFVTETMAELYLQQGFTAEALEVYRQLSAADPSDEGLKMRVRKLERGDRNSMELNTVPEFDGAPANDFVHNLMPEAAPPAPPEPAPESAQNSARSYFAGLSARRAVQGNGRARTAARTSPPRTSAPHIPAASFSASSVSLSATASLDELFAGGTISPSDEHIALAFAQVAGAVEMGAASVRGKPTAPAETELSLDSVFSEVDARATGAVPRQSQTLRFDQFFATSGEEAAPEQPARRLTPAGEPGSPAELQQFQSWLTGLKKP